VLLGASNLTRGLSTVIETSRLRWGSPRDVLAAIGRGRSFGISHLLGRTLPGILDCELWSALAQRPSVPTHALVTDIGNDLLYEAPVERIVDWVRTCLDRLLAAGARTVMTRLPLANIERLTPRRYRWLRAILVPRCSLSFAEVIERAVAIDEHLCRLAREREITLVEHRSQWYGFDPIHIRKRWSSRAWLEIMAAGANMDDHPRARASAVRWIYLQSRAPRQRWLFGLEQRRAQPCGRLRDGTTVSLY
jgi:hypothetical protein